MQISFGDRAQSLLLRQHSASTKAEITRLTEEVTTGLTSEAAAHLSGDLGQIDALDGALARLKAFGAATSELQLYAGAMQSGLTVIADLSERAGAALLPARASASAAQVDAAAQTAAAGFETLVATLNTRLGDRSLFAGTATSATALSGASAILTTLEGVVAGAATTDEIAARVSDWFDDPAGFAATAYQGGPPPAEVPVAEGERLGLGVTAADPALRAAMKGLALGALLDRGLLTGQPEARQSLAGLAGEGLLAAQDGLTGLASGLGATEARIDQAASRNSAESAALEIGRTGLLGLDPYETASRLQNAEKQMDLLYALTSRLSRLSLVEYLR